MIYKWLGRWNINGWNISGWNVGGWAEIIISNNHVTGGNHGNRTQSG